MSYLIPPRRADSADVEAFVASVQKVKDNYEAEVMAEAQEPVAWLHNSRTQADVITSAVKKLLIDEKSRHGFNSLIQRFPVSKAENYTIPLYTAPQPPAPCPKCTSYAAMSWGGNNVYGDASSIHSVKDAVHYAGQVPELKDTIKALQAKVAELKEKMFGESETFVNFLNIDHPKALGERDRIIAQQSERIAELDALSRECGEKDALIALCEVAMQSSNYDRMTKALAAIAAHRKVGE